MCTNDASENYVKNKRKKLNEEKGAVHLISSLDTVNTLIEALTEKKEDPSYEIPLKVLTKVKDLKKEIRYHDICYQDLLRRTLNISPGRPESASTKQLLEHVAHFLMRNEDECQFSVEEILRNYEGPCLTDQYFLTKLKEKFGDDIVVTRLKNRSPIICFKNTGDKLISDYW